ncbi:hypothetical protein BGX29_000229 [Mortierella sp. GBA35]|nr:hypothetical protein BGX29_000229 [Mortierella sp. GBA35]
MDTLPTPPILLQSDNNKKTCFSSTSTTTGPKRSSFYNSLATFFILCHFLLLSNIATMVSAQSTTTDAGTITLSFLDTLGNPLGPQPQSISRSACTPLNTSAFTTTTITTTISDPEDPTTTTTDDINTPTAGTYALATASDQHAALNLYADDYCQIMVSSAVGLWNNTGSLTGMKAIRWEGTAPLSLAPGTLGAVAFPPNMAPQALSPVDEDGTPKKKHHDKPHQQFIVDPSKGRILVGFVSAILIIGIIFGAHQVYKAAQYVPPNGGIRSRPGSILSGSGKGGPGYGGVGAKKIKKKDAYYRKPTTAMVASPNEKDRDQAFTSHSSMATLATLRATGSPHQALTMDVREESSTPTLFSHSNQGQSGSSSLSRSSSSHSRVLSQPPRLEVLVPIQSAEGKSSFMGCIE